LGIPDPKEYPYYETILSVFNILHGKSRKLILTNTFDNEVNLPSDYIPGLKMLPEKLQRFHLYGSDEEAEGLVFDEFRRGEHIIDPFEIPQGWDRIVALDHGFTNPTAVIWGAIDFDGKIYIYDEHYEKEKLVSHHSSEIKKRDNSRVTDWLIDPSCAAKTIQKNGGIFSVVDEYRDNGLFFRGADNNVLAGINRVNEFLKSKKVFIFKNCQNLIREIEAYRWQSLRPGQEKNNPEAPIKRNDHAVDAWRYMIFSRPASTLVPEIKNRPGSAADLERMEEQQAIYDEV
jgi:phage terminase large subunit